MSHLRLGLRLGGLWLDDPPGLSSLFAAGQPGYWPGGYDPAAGRLWQTSAGSPAVTGAGQPVGLVLDAGSGPAGGDLLVNGDFSAGLSGWAPTADSTIATVGGRLRVGSAVGTPNGRWAYQAVQTEIGRRYMVRAHLSALVGGLAYFRVVNNTSTPWISVATTSMTALGGVSLIFVATAATTYLMLGVDGSSLANLADYSMASMRVLQGRPPAAQATALSRPTLARWPKGGRRNLLLRSEDFANGLWPQSQMTVASGAVAAPVAGRMADKIVATAVDGGKFVYQTVTPGAANVFSFYAKAAEHYLLRAMEIGSYAWRATFDLSSGVISQSGGASFVAAGMAAVGGGWWRCWLSSSRAGSSAFSVAGFPDDIPPPTNTPASYTGDVMSGLYVWGAQVEIGPAPSAYQRVTTANDVTDAGVPDAWHLSNDGDDSLPVTLPAGLYGRASIDHLGNVAVDTVTLATAGPVETLVHQRQADVVIRQGVLSAPEIARIESYARRVAG